MFRYLIPLFFIAGSAFGQSSPNWGFGYVPPPSEWNALWAGKLDVNAVGAPLTAGPNVRCDGFTDDTVAANAYLATFTKGGVVYVPTGLQCLVNSGDLVVPAGVILAGVGSPQMLLPNGSLPVTSAILLNPSYSVILSGQGAMLRDIAVLRSGLLANPTVSQVIAAVTQWGAERSIGVVTPQNVGGTNLYDVFIMGFNTCYETGAGQYTLKLVSGDCYNGLDAYSGGDNSYIDTVRWEPYYALGTSATSGSWARPGVGFNFHDGDTGHYLTHSFTFMYANPVLMSNTAIIVDNSGFEWQAVAGNGLTGTIGLRMVGSCGGCQVLADTFNGFDVAISDEVSDEVNIISPSVYAANVEGIYLSGHNATNVVDTISGSFGVGATASQTFTSASIAGSPITVTYVTVVGDGAAQVAIGLGKKINSTQALAVAHVASYVSGSTTTGIWPQDETVTITVSSTGGIAQALTTNTSMPQGSSGRISDANLNFSNVPDIVAGNSVGFTNQWVISNPMLTGSGAALPPNWLQVPSGGALGSSVSLVLSGIPWSNTFNSNISGCGTGPTLVGNSGTDIAGTINTGTGSPSSCTLTFTTPFWKVPQCVFGVISANGGMIYAASISKTGFTLTTPGLSSQQYSYSCQVQ